ncbi:MAG: hypothetical protein M3T49_07430 [Candidatus Eremiobacteraeota bacterium]|nr:hypothetical protein [Candidatus Eremiobacteraeota bacterium]
MHSLDDAAFLPRLIAGTAASAVTWFAAVGVGKLLVGSALDDETRGLRLAVGAACGYAVVGSGVAVLAAFHGLRPTCLAVLLVIIIGARGRGNAADLRALGAFVIAQLSAWRRGDLMLKCSWLVFAFAVLTAALGASLPSVSWDPIAYHLPVAAAALVNGTFSFDPGMTQTGFPLLGEAAALPAYALAGSAGASFVTLGAGIVLALLCGGLAARYRTSCGPLATMLAGSSGLWLWLAPSFYVDVPFAMLVVASLSVATRGVAESARIGLICGLCAGAAAGVKYPGLVDGLLSAAILVILARRRPGPAAAAFAGAFVAVAGAWYLRSLVLTGDPLYPFLSSTLGKSQSVREFAARYVAMTRHWCGGPATVRDALALPWRMLTAPRQYCGDPGFALRLGVLFFVMGAALIPGLRLLALTAGALTLSWFVESRQDRFVIPGAAVYGVVVAVGTYALSARIQRVGALCLIALSFCGVLLDWVPADVNAASASIVPGARYLTGKQSGAGYLSDRLESYDVASWAARHLAPTAKVLDLNDVRDYYFARSMAWANPYYQPVWNIDWSLAPVARYAEARRRGYRYVVADRNPAYLRRSPSDVDWSALSRDVASGALKLMFSAHGESLMRIEGVDLMPSYRGPP